MISEATGNTAVMYSSTASSGPLVLAAWRGEEARTLELSGASIETATSRGEGRAISLAVLARAILGNGLGRYHEAAVAAQRACEHEDLALVGWGLVELIDASARSGRRDVATDALRRLHERTAISGTDWALGTRRARGRC